MDILLTDGLRPFTTATGFLVVFLVLEVVLMMVGLSSSIEADAPEIPDPALEMEAALLDMPEIDADLVSLETAEAIATADLRPGEERHIFHHEPTGWRKWAGMIGIGNGPLLVGLSSIAMWIAALGYFVQLGMEARTTFMLPGWFAFTLVLVPALLIAGRFTKFLARLLPSVETSAVSGNVFHGRIGRVTHGVSRRGRPAQVRWNDFYGNTHQLMAEPLWDEDHFEAGDRVLIVKTRDRKPRLAKLPS